MKWLPDPEREGWYMPDAELLVDLKARYPKYSHKGIRMKPDTARDTLIFDYVEDEEMKIPWYGRWWMLLLGPAMTGLVILILWLCGVAK